MRHLLGSLILVTATSVGPSAVSLLEAEQAERNAYHRWRDAIEANTALGTPFWLSSDSGPPELRTAVQDLVSFGPNPKSITPVRRYGVFAIPFIAESLRQQDSPELFAAFLIITGETDLYTKYINDPSGSIATRGEKLAFITAWAGRNVDKVDTLHGLHERIRSLAGR